MSHATVKIDGVDIPLIGINPKHTEEKCQVCQQKFHLSEIVYTGKLFLCGKCHENTIIPDNSAQLKAEERIKKRVVTEIERRAKNLETTPRSSKLQKEILMITAEAYRDLANWVNNL